MFLAADDGPPLSKLPGIVGTPLPLVFYVLRVGRWIVFFQRDGCASKTVDGSGGEVDIFLMRSRSKNSSCFYRRSRLSAVSSSHEKEVAEERTSPCHVRVVQLLTWLVGHTSNTYLSADATIGVKAVIARFGQKIS